MKFFLPRACDVFDEDIELFREAYGGYKRHLVSLHGVLSDHVLELADLSGTNDALIAKVEHDREKRVLRLTLRSGDIQRGYYNLVLTYKARNCAPNTTPRSPKSPEAPTATSDTAAISPGTNWMWRKTG